MYIYIYIYIKIDIYIYIYTLKEDQKRKENQAEETFHLRFDREKNQLMNEINVLERRLEDQLGDFDRQKENIRQVCVYVLSVN
jgi:hypothetical protein